MPRQSAIYYNIDALGKRWQLTDLPEQWIGYHLLAGADSNHDRAITGEEILDIDWLSFVHAIKDFQRDYNLPIDGKLGPNTLSTLQEVFLTPKQRPLFNLGNLTLYRPEIPTSSPEYLVELSLTPQERRIASIWNQYGKIIAQQADFYGIELKTALGVFQVESGSAFDPHTGLVIIRFEPHIFKRRSGYSVQINRGSQSEEWRALSSAYELHPAAALESTSYGLPQIMGFNAQTINYSSAEKLLLAFQNSCEAQVQGFFRFLQANKLIPVVNDHNWELFARKYNGPGNVATYQSRLSRTMEMIDFMIEDGAEFIA